MKKIEYFIFGTGEHPVKVIYEETPWTGDVLGFDFALGDFTLSPGLYLEIWRGHDPSEQVSEEEFQSYVTKLQEVFHLDAPRYYIHDKFPIRALPRDSGMPDVRKFNIETDEFDIHYSYDNLVRIHKGEVGRVSQEEWEHRVQEIRIWRDRLEVPKYYILGKGRMLPQPIKIVRGDDNRLHLMGYISTNDTFIPAGWHWEKLFPPVNPNWVFEVSESEVQQHVREERLRALERKQRHQSK